MFSFRRHLGPMPQRHVDSLEQRHSDWIAAFAKFRGMTNNAADPTGAVDDASGQEPPADENVPREAITAAESSDRIIGGAPELASDAQQPAVVVHPDAQVLAQECMPSQPGGAGPEQACYRAAKAAGPEQACYRAASSFRATKTKGEGDGFICTVCGMPQPWSCAYNASGNRQYPCWQDSGCANAVKRLHAAIESEQGKKALKDLRKNREEYALRVLELKHSHTAGQCQRMACVKMVEKMIVLFAVRKIHGFELMDHDSYIAHKMYQKAKTREEAESLWQADLQNDDIHQITDMSVTYLAVRMNTKIEIEQQVQKSFEIESNSQQLKSQREKEHGLKRAFDLLHSSASSAIFDGVDGRISLSGTPGGLSEWTMNKHARSSQEIQLEEAFGGKEDLVVPDQSSLNPAQMALQTQQRLVDRQAVLVKGESLMGEHMGIVKRLEQKFTEKTLTTLSEESRATFNITAVIQDIKDSATQTAKLMEEIRKVEPHDFYEHKERFTALLDNKRKAVSAWQEVLNTMVLRLNEEKTKVRKMNRATTTQKMQVASQAIKRFHASLPISCQTFVGKLLSLDGGGTTLTNGLAPKFPTSTPMDLALYPHWFDGATEQGLAIKSMFDPWEGKWAAKLEAGQVAVSADGTSRCAVGRFSPPPPNSTSGQAFAVASWLTKLRETSSVLESFFESPVAPDSKGLPWMLTLRTTCVVSECASIPCNGLGGWVTAWASTVVIVAIHGKVLAGRDPVTFLHATSGRDTNAFIKRQKIMGRLLNVGESLWVPPCWSIMVMAAGTQEELSATLTWMPHLAPEIIKTAVSKGGFIDGAIQANQYAAEANAASPHWKFIDVEFAKWFFSTFGVGPNPSGAPRVKSLGSKGNAGGCFATQA